MTLKLDDMIPVGHDKRILKYILNSFQQKLPLRFTKNKVLYYVKRKLGGVPEGFGEKPGDFVDAWAEAGFLIKYLPDDAKRGHALNTYEVNTDALEEEKEVKERVIKVKKVEDIGEFKVDADLEAMVETKFNMTTALRDAMMGYTALMGINVEELVIRGVENQLLNENYLRKMSQLKEIFPEAYSSHGGPALDYLVKKRTTKLPAGKTFK